MVYDTRITKYFVFMVFINQRSHHCGAPHCRNQSCFYWMNPKFRFTDARPATTAATDSYIPKTLIGSTKWWPQDS